MLKEIKEMLKLVIQSALLFHFDNFSNTWISFLGFLLRSIPNKAHHI
jgi:hypothetical protein